MESFGNVDETTVSPVDADTSFEAEYCNAVLNANQIEMFDKCEEMIRGREVVGIKWACLKDRTGQIREKVKLKNKWCEEDGTFKTQVVTCIDYKISKMSFRTRRKYALVAGSTSETKNIIKANECRAKLLQF